MTKGYPKIVLAIGLVLIALILFQGTALAQPHFEIPDIQLEIGDDAAEDAPLNLETSMMLLFLLTILSLAPAILILVTSFTRIVIVLSLLRRGLALQMMPPNQVIISLAIFLTVFIMSPVWSQVNDEALQPYLAEEIEQDVALENTIDPLRDFMLAHTREKDIALFVNFSEIDRPESEADIPLYVLIPAFVISELQIAFQIGFMIYLPFIVIDMIVASTLMSMGMMMLPPVMISLPFKLLLFVLVDGWYLVIKSVMETFN